MQHTFVSNEKKSLEIMSKIKSEGLNKVHILADFDRTLTKAFYNGELRPSLISVLRKEGYLGEEYSKKAYELFNYYNPIEINPNISLEEKKKEMTNWWNKHLELLVKSNLHKNDLEKIVSSGVIEFRPGVKKLLKFLSENNIPIVIISANGLGTDSIKLYFEKSGFLTPNIHIISNEFLWNEKGNAIGYDKRVIHVFNKDETVLSEFPKIHDLVKDRKNVILLGDSLGDPSMIEGFNYENLLKIGFLNEKENELLENYNKLYDIVLTGDNNGEFLEEILK